MTKFLIPILFLCSTALFAQNNGNEIKIGIREKIISKYLDEPRECQVYLPPTYGFNDNQRFPVIYLMDGDYNFQYVTGMIELMSNVSGKMPECIVVGISDKGSTKYRSNCTPNQAPDLNGNADNYMNFIENELKPMINERYKTANYDLLIGHSIGGLFVTNFMLEKPEAFDAFIAIDPAYWPGKFELIDRADSVLKRKNEAEPLFYLSSSSARGMGINKFVKVLKKRYSKENWGYFKLKEENHNSVGLPTLKNAFEAIFDGWDITEREFLKFKNASGVIDHFTELSKKYPAPIVTIHPYFLGNIIYYYFNADKKDDLLILENGIKEYFPHSLEEFYNQMASRHFKKAEYEKALEFYSKSIDLNPLAFNAFDGKAKVLAAQKNYKDALMMCEKALSIGKFLNARKWMMNQLNANSEAIRAEAENQKK